MNQRRVDCRQTPFQVNYTRAQQSCSPPLELIWIDLLFDAIPLDYNGQKVCKPVSKNDKLFVENYVE